MMRTMKVIMMTEEDEDYDELSLTTMIMMMRMIKESASLAPGRLKPKMAPYRDTMDQHTAPLVIIIVMAVVMMMTLLMMMMSWQMSCLLYFYLPKSTCLLVLFYLPVRCGPVAHRGLLSNQEIIDTK